MIALYHDFAEGAERKPRKYASCGSLNADYRTEDLSNMK
jgi:hypothetical protein